MNYERREEIFSKEILTIENFQDLFGVDYYKASAMIRQIKRCVPDRLGIQGKIHIQDYFDYYHITEMDRYKIPPKILT